MLYRLYIDAVGGCSTHCVLMFILYSHLLQPLNSWGWITHCFTGQYNIPHPGSGHCAVEGENPSWSCKNTQFSLSEVPCSLQFTARPTGVSLHVSIWAVGGARQGAHYSWDYKSQVQTSLWSVCTVFHLIPPTKHVKCWHRLFTSNGCSFDEIYSSVKRNAIKWTQHICSIS